MVLVVVDSQLRAPKNAPSDAAPQPMSGLSKMCKNVLSGIRGKALFGAAMASADFYNVLNGRYLRKQNQFFYLLLLWALTLSEKRTCSNKRFYHCYCSLYLGKGIEEGTIHIVRILTQRFSMVNRKTGRMRYTIVIFGRQGSLEWWE